MESRGATDMRLKRLGLVHTSAANVPLFEQLCRAKLSGVETFNIVDDSLIKDVMAGGGLTEKISRRVANQIAAAEAAGADFILVTCSSIGPAVEAAASLASVPVLRVDQPMADRAVQTGSRIGIIATLPSTLSPTADLIQRRAAIAKKEVTLATWLCEGAFDALMSGDAARHDAMVIGGLRELAAKTDVIVLAQASMARVVDALAKPDQRVPILASPPIALEHVAAILLANRGT